MNIENPFPVPTPKPDLSSSLDTPLSLPPAGLGSTYPQGLSVPFVAPPPRAFSRVQARGVV